VCETYLTLEQTQFSQNLETLDQSYPNGEPCHTLISYTKPNTGVQITRYK